MWRSLFLAIGISLCILGAECLLVEKAVLAIPSESQDSAFPSNRLGSQNKKKEVEPPEWAPWGLLSAGTVISLYSVTLARGG